MKSNQDLPKGDLPVIQQGDPMVAGYSQTKNPIDASPSHPVFVFGDHTCRMKILTEPFIALPNTIALRSKTGNTFWAYHATKGLQSFETYRRHWMELAVRKVVVPPTSVMTMFDNVARPFWEEIALLERQIRTSKELLASLIPQLVSGHLKIPEGTVL
jgi:type I restriction enzyme S subunit